MASRSENTEGVCLGGNIRPLIERATSSTAGEVDHRLLKAIKHIVRYSDYELQLAAETLIDLMKCNHSQVRYLALQVIDELFMRSKLFRSIMVEKLDFILTMSIGFRRNRPLPAPAAIASNLRSKAIELLEKWNSAFGIHYKHIRIGYDYLKNTLRLQFPNIQENAARIEQAKRDREARTQEILRDKFEILKSRFPIMKEEIQATVIEIAECLDIVHGEKETRRPNPFNEEDDEDGVLEFRPSELWQIRSDSLKEGEKVHENSENKVVLDALREQYKLLVTKHLVTVQESISLLVRADIADNKFRDSMVKEFIDLRNNLILLKNKCLDSVSDLLHQPTPENEEDEEEEKDFWEMGSVESVEEKSFPKEEDEKVADARDSPSGLLHPNVVDELAEQAASDIREGDKLERQTRRKLDQRSLRRLKMAKIQEHNNAVLREAALDSCSRSALVGEDNQASVGKKRSNRSSKDALSSMLRKKVTARDRLSRKLLKKSFK